MKYIFIVIISCFSGIISGMGMGGGTFLIPALTLFFNYSQKISQVTNIICFIVVSLLCIPIYIKKKLIDFKTVIFIAIPASIFSSFLSILSTKVSSEFLKICFVIFVIIFGFFYLIKTYFHLKKRKKLWNILLKSLKEPKMFYINIFFC